ncbi:hypothetical protein AVEN_30824-1 [Araneus ventricosus]|uniref:Uncharacterized protein n=1 Tax=Araneus ventricosus TaxID=182803 RepID=A0A4Y2KPX0_ARAVE|nr:hypothetical protein AVEN_30824-1 [Araneus ventricosus]
MKAIFALFVIVAIIGMVVAGVHHYKVGGNGGHAHAAPQQVADSAHHGGSIFDAAASGLNAIGGAVDDFFG